MSGWWLGAAGVLGAIYLSAKQDEREEREFLAQQALREREYNRHIKLYLVEEDYLRFHRHALWTDYIDYCIHQSDKDRYRESFLTWYSSHSAKIPIHTKHRIDLNALAPYARESERLAKQVWSSLL